MLLLTSGLRRRLPPVAPNGPQRLHLLPRGQAVCRAAPYSVRATSRTTIPRPDLQQQRLPHGALPPLPLPPQEQALAGQQAASAHACMHAPATCRMQAAMQLCCLECTWRLCIHSEIGPCRTTCLGPEILSLSQPFSSVCIKIQYGRAIVFRAWFLSRLYIQVQRGRL